MSSEMMDVDKVQECGNIAQNKTVSVTVSLHPLVLMNIADHWTRVHAQDGINRPVSGVLFGKQTGRELEITNSFELVVRDNAIIDEQYYSEKENQFKQVTNDLDLLGWYTTGDGAPVEHEIKIHKQICNINENAVLLKLNPQPLQLTLPVAIYESVVDVVNDPNNIQFVEVQFSVVMEEAERIGLDNVAKMSISDLGGDTVLDAMVNQRNAARMMYRRSRVMIDYLKAVKQDQVVKNKLCLRRISIVANKCDVLLNDPRLKSDLLSHHNDLSQIVCLAATTKATHVLNRYLNKFNVLHSEHDTSKSRKGHV